MSVLALGPVLVMLIQILPACGSKACGPEVLCIVAEIGRERPIIFARKCCGERLVVQLFKFWAVCLHSCLRVLGCMSIALGTFWSCILASLPWVQF